MRDTETLEESKHSFRSIFKGLHRDRISKGRRKKENRRKSNARKKKRFENNVQRVYSICVGNPLGNDLPKCLLYPPCLAVPEGCIDVEKVSELLLIEMRHTLHSSCKETFSATPQEEELSQTSSRRFEITCTASCTLTSMLWRKTTKATLVGARKNIDFSKQAAHNVVLLPAYCPPGGFADVDLPWICNRM